MPRCPGCDELTGVSRDWIDRCWRCPECGFAWRRPGGGEEIVEVRETTEDGEDV